VGGYAKLTGDGSIVSAVERFRCGVVGVRDEHVRCRHVGGAFHALVEMLDTGRHVTCERVPEFVRQRATVVRGTEVTAKADSPRVVVVPAFGATVVGGDGDP